jgi:rubrerythrin
MKSVIFSALSLALLSACVGCATRAAAKELPEGFPESTAAPLKAESQEASPSGLGALSATAPSHTDHEVDSHGDHNHHGHGHTQVSDSAAELGSAAESDSAAESGGTAQADSKSKQAGVYTCPMHPEVTAPAPGQCPICGMHLEKKK